MPSENINNNSTIISQLKLHTNFGGGEVYARFLCEAISRIGFQPLIVTHPDATYWNYLPLPPNTIKLQATNTKEAIALTPSNTILINHAPMSKELVQLAAENHTMVCIVHMPYTGDPRSFDGYHRVLGVSKHVIHSLQVSGIDPWPIPLLGVSDVKRGEANKNDLFKTSEFDWDQRKVRDRFLGATEPVWSKLRPQPTFNKIPGSLTLGIVSRLATIKKFPELFNHLSDVISKIPEVRIEIFGSGGYAQVRDIKKSLEPINGKVRFWGHQHDIVSIYKNVDFVLSGLPEREALGLNLIEAQQLGTPVIAVDAPPFTETVSNGVTGWLYKDPREDNGADFQKLLTGIINEELILDDSQKTAYLEKFSMVAFSERLYNALIDLTT